MGYKAPNGRRYPAYLRIASEVRYQADADYLHTLSEEDRQWYAQFQDEYYAANGRKHENAIHTMSQFKQIDAALYAAKSDVCNVSSTKAAMGFQPSRKHAYTPTDYCDIAEVDPPPASSRRTVED
jgi:hypothetical protein